MNYWIITDTHFGHDKMIELCGRPENFSHRILNNLKSTIRWNDVLIHLGDICIGNDEKWHSLFWEAAPGRRWLVKGNHDRKSDNWYLEHGWDFVADMVWLEKFGKKILFSHKPMEDCGYDINIHGHFHNADFRRYEPELVAIKNDKQILLALEYNNYMPISLEKLVRQAELV